MAGGLAQVRAGLQQAVAHFPTLQHLSYCFCARLLSLHVEAFVKVDLRIRMYVCQCLIPGTLVIRLCSKKALYMRNIVMLCGLA